jgi:hypothetical protein
MNLTDEQWMWLELLLSKPPHRPALTGQAVA